MIDWADEGDMLVLQASLGRHLVVVRCRESLTGLLQMNQFLNGMIQSGSWALFDDTDHMTTGNHGDDNTYLTPLTSPCQKV